MQAAMAAIVLRSLALLVGLGDCRGLRIRERPSLAGPAANTSGALPPGQLLANLHAVGQQLARRSPESQPSFHVELPKVYFLFLAVEKVSNLGVWNSFFSQATNAYYRAFVHCKMPSCKASLEGSTLEVVPTVPSYYCTDLVSPMQQLISSALLKDKGGNSMDKFVFVSDSSLPAKPFSEVYAKLVGRQGSDFCVFPPTEWADKPSQGVIEVAPKHHQWMVLNRRHAEESFSKWSSGQGHDFMARFRMNQLGYYHWMNNSYADSRNFGCLDEFWHMSALFGPISQPIGGNPRKVDLPLFIGGPLRIAENEGWQGKCDTFVMWAKYLDAPASGDVSPFKKFYMSLDKASLPHSGNDQRPGWWDSISERGMRAIRASEFLFVRKFTDNPTLTDGSHDFAASFSRIVLA